MAIITQTPSRGTFIAHFVPKLSAFDGSTKFDQGGGGGVDDNIGGTVRRHDNYVLSRAER